MRHSPSGTSLSASEIKVPVMSPDSGQPMKRWRFFEEYQDDSNPFVVQVDTDDKEDVFAGIGVSSDVSVKSLNSDIHRLHFCKIYFPFMLAFQMSCLFLCESSNYTIHMKRKAYFWED